MQSEAPEGAMRPAEGAIALSAPVWLRAWTAAGWIRQCMDPAGGFRGGGGFSEGIQARLPPKLKTLRI